MSLRPPEIETIGTLRSGRIGGLRPMDLATAAALSPMLAEMEPWKRLGSSAEGLARTMYAPANTTLRSWCLTVDGEMAGVLAVHEGWLLGPYLRRLAVLPTCQRQGLAQAALDWWEADARRSRAANLWLSVANFNASAQRLYETAGFRQAAVLEDLVAPGITEILMRKQLNRPAQP